MCDVRESAGGEELDNVKEVDRSPVSSLPEVNGVAAVCMDWEGGCGRLLCGVGIGCLGAEACSDE